MVDNTRNRKYEVYPMTTLLTSSPIAKPHQLRAIVTSVALPLLTETEKAELLMARWASMCVGNHVTDDQLLQDERALLELCTLKGTAPLPGLVRKMHPELYESIETLDTPITVALVRAHFRNHKCPTPAVFGKVGTMVRPSGLVWWFQPNDSDIKPFRVINPYYTLTQGQKVGVHATDKTMRGGFVADDLSD
jgi:hypothetical protein